MLILSRKVGEEILIGDGIVVTVFEIRGDAVRIGVEADKSIPVHRREVYEAILQREAQESAGDSDEQ